MDYSSFPSSVPQAPMPMNPPPTPPVGLTLMGQSQALQGQFDGQSQMMMNGQPMPGQLQQQAMQQMQQLQHQLQQQMQQMQQMMHPAMNNDQPLEFNINKNKPPMVIVNEEANAICEKSIPLQRSEDSDRRDLRDRDNRRNGRERERRDRERDRDRSKDERKGKRRNSETEKEQSAPTENAGITAGMSGMPMMGMNSMMGGMMGSMMPGMMPMMTGMDPTMMSMGQYGMMPGMVPDASGTMISAEGNMSTLIGGDGTSMTYPSQQRPLLEFKECTLVPPSVNAPPPATRERPLGCRTVYVGGLPDNCTEEIIRDVFGRCGEMLNVRLSKKNFCHIRFAHETSVDAAMLYSGYRMRIGNQTDAANTGRLHVDYAQARVDQYEYECRQRALQREARHRERLERDRLRPASPPPVPHYTDHEAASTVDLIKTDEGFRKAVQTVVAWLERGDLNKRNANTFYSMIQSTHSHVRRLLNEKMQYEEELQTAKDIHRQHMMNIVVQFEYIEKIFTCAAHKKCWDHFTKAQRKNIEAWKKQSAEIKQLQLVGSLNEEADEEMELSDAEDGEGPQKKRARNDVGSLKEENDSLRCQLEAYKNEVDLVKADLKVDIQSKDRQIKVLQQTVQKMTMELAMSKGKLRSEEGMVKKLKAKVKVHEGDKEGGEMSGCLVDDKPLYEEDVSSADGLAMGACLITDRDAKLVGLISTFLHVHPFGASVDYIWSYLTKLDPALMPNEVEALMRRFPVVFRQELSGIGAAMERRWIFCGFEASI